MKLKERLIIESNIIADFIKKQNGEAKLMDIVENTKESIHWGNKKSYTNRMTTIMKYNPHIKRCETEGRYRYEEIKSEEYVIRLPKSLYEWLKGKSIEEGVSVDEYTTYLLAQQMEK
jgi:hypothetical protein